MNLPSCIETLCLLTESRQFEYEWLNNESCCGWEKHRYSFQRFETEINVCVNAILPMINEEVHRLDKMYHVMNRNKKITNVLNPSQTPVDTCDQPVCALTKTIQWMYPKTLDSGKYLS